MKRQMFEKRSVCNDATDVSYLISVNNSDIKFLVDCGSPIALDISDALSVKAIFISHTHFDHFVGFPSFIRYVQGSGNTIRIVGPKSITTNVVGILQGFTWNLADIGSLKLEVYEILEDGKIEVNHLEAPNWEMKNINILETNTVYNHDDFNVSYSVLDHGIPSIAYLFKPNIQVKFLSDQSSYRPGAWISELKKAYSQNDHNKLILVENIPIRSGSLFYLFEEVPFESIGFIMDHAATHENHQRIITLFKGADQIFIENYYSSEDKNKALKNKHSYTAASGEVMRLAEIKKAIPIHFSNRYSLEEIQEIELEFNQCFRDM